MPDKKLTDSKKIAKWQKEKLGDKNYNEIQEKAKHNSKIMKGLECCKNDGIICWECPYKKANGCMEKLSADALDLINRLQAENERLQKNLEEAETEAYKNFDELLKEDCLSYPLEKDDITMLVDVESYNNLLKELVGEDK